MDADIFTVAGINSILISNAEKQVYAHDKFVQLSKAVSAGDRQGRHASPGREISGRCKDSNSMIGSPSCSGIRWPPAFCRARSPAYATFAAGNVIGSTEKVVYGVNRAVVYADEVHQLQFHGHHGHYHRCAHVLHDCDIKLS